jgi:hypothetical protein
MSRIAGACGKVDGRGIFRCLVAVVPRNELYSFTYGELIFTTLRVMREIPPVMGRILD